MRCVVPRGALRSPQDPQPARSWPPQFAAPCREGAISKRGLREPLLLFPGGDLPPEGIRPLPKMGAAHGLLGRVHDPRCRVVLARRLAVSNSARQWRFRSACPALHPGRTRPVREAAAVVSANPRRIRPRLVRAIQSRPRFPRRIRWDRPAARESARSHPSGRAERRRHKTSSSSGPSAMHHHRAGSPARFAHG